MDQARIGKRSAFGVAAKSVALLAMVMAVAALVASCGTADLPSASGDGTNNVQPYCVTPNDGCPCNTPGEIVECGTVKDVSGDHVSCSMGNRQCLGGHWGACVGEAYVTTKTLAVGGAGGVGTLATNVPVSCGGGTLNGPGRCVGGPDDNDGCDSPADCAAPGVCQQVFGVCEHGTQDGELCFAPADCPGGMCKGVTLLCDEGSNDGKHCMLPADCPGGTCSAGWGACHHGMKKGKQCKHADKCPGGLCYQNNIFNACDPYCSAFVDSAGTIPVPTGGGPPACKSATTPSAYYATYTGTTAPNGPPPTTCTAAPDNCSDDSTCTAGVCVPNAPSALGSCVGADFTLSTPCYDGANFTFQICNRGSVDANTGILPISHNAGAPSVAASTGTRAVNGAVGQCNLNLAVTPLAAGQCRQVTPATDCGINTSVGVHAFYVNYANLPMPSATPVLAECDTTNNYTATTDAAIPVAGAACVASSCGTTSPGGGQYPPNFSSPDGLNTSCTTATNDVVAGACTGAPGAYSNCGQDFHCDTVSNTCKWNVTGDWVDTSCAGVDLTIGAGCKDATPTYHVPVCNRGLGTLAAGSTIAINISSTAWTAATACTTNVGAYHCGLTIAQPLLSGQCVDIPGCTGQTGQRELIVNPAGTIAECSQCNNWAHTRTDGTGCAVACTVPPAPSVQIYGHSGSTLYRVDPVTYGVTTVGAMSGCGTTFDLAIDATGNMYSVDSANKLYKVTYPATGAGAVSCTYLATGPTSFNGLTFTPTSLLTPTPAAEPLHGQANNGGWYELKLTAGGAPVTYTLKGYYGGAANVIQSSGDSVGIIGDAEYAVVKSGSSSLPGGDHLWKVDANNGAKITDITPTGSGLGACYGIAYWGGKTYLFCGSPSSGIYTIDTTTGSTTLVKATPAISWYGAAVTTSAPTIPPTPAAPPAPTQYFTRDYVASCPTGTRVSWSFFSWQATIPMGGSIGFQAQTAALPTAFGPANAAPSAMPPAVGVGTASVTTIPPGAWYKDANTVDWHLQHDPPGGQVSLPNLRITMKFNTGMGTVPDLLTWKQEYDCVPAE